MDDLDILVRPAQTAIAVDVLTRHDWSAPVPDPVTHLIVINGTEFLDPRGDGSIFMPTCFRSASVRIATRCAGNGR